MVWVAPAPMTPGGSNRKVTMFSAAPGDNGVGLVVETSSPSRTTTSCPGEADDRGVKANRRAGAVDKAPRQSRSREPWRGALSQELWVCLKSWPPGREFVEDGHVGGPRRAWQPDGGVDMPAGLLQRR